MRISYLNLKTTVFLARHSLCHVRPALTTPCLPVELALILCMAWLGAGGPALAAIRPGDVGSLLRHAAAEVTSVPWHIVQLAEVAGAPGSFKVSSARRGRQQLLLHLGGGGLWVYGDLFLTPARPQLHRGVHATGWPSCL